MDFLRRIFLSLTIVFLLSACSDGVSVNVNSDTNTITGDWYRPLPATTWQLQLSGEINSGYDVELYDIDLYDSSITLIEQLQQSGKKVICYFSAGSYEDWREDAEQFASEDLGKPLAGWEGEFWLDIRSEAVREIMKSRMDLAVEKSCDGVDPDNVNAYANDTGFSLSADDQLDYNRFLANEAHKRNLSVGLKNDLDQIEELVEYFDFSVNEECFEFNECDLLTPFIDNNKAVLNVEYMDNYVNDASARDALCTDANERQFSTLVLPLILDDSFRFSCQ